MGYRYGCLPIISVLIGMPALAEPSLSVSAMAIATNLDLDGQGGSSTHIEKIATVSVSNAGSHGYTLTISSGSLSKTGGTPIAFQITTVPKDDSAPEGSQFTVSSGNSYSLCSSNADLDIYMKYTPASLQDPGNYSGAIVASVVDNSAACP